MGRQIIDDCVELIVGAICAFVDHVADNLLPAVFGVAVAQNNFRGMTSATDFLHCRFAGPVGKLG